MQHETRITTNLNLNVILTDYIWVWSLLKLFFHIVSFRTNPSGTLFKCNLDLFLVSQVLLEFGLEIKGFKKTFAASLQPLIKRFSVN